MDIRQPLPQSGGAVLLTDGGIETDLIFRQGWDLPDFAAFVLLADGTGREALRNYYRPYLLLAASAGFGVVLETPTWRASRDWGRRLGYDAAGLERVNRQGVWLLNELREEAAPMSVPVLVSGCIGPRADGFDSDDVMSAEQAEEYHAPQVDALAASASDLVTALTLAYPAEAIGVVRAAGHAGVPVVISFTVRTDGRLPDGSSLEEAIRQVEQETQGAPAYYMVNCAHFSHLRDTFGGAASSPWTSRLRGLRANASERSHAELDAAADLDDGDPTQFGAQFVKLLADLPALTVLGGCCGTDARHIEAVARSISHAGRTRAPIANDSGD